MVCPHGLTHSIDCDSFEIDQLLQDIRNVFQNANCGHVSVARHCIWRSKPANDDNHLPANDDHRVPANDDHAPDAAEVAIPRLIP